MLGVMATIDEVELLPDADQHKLLIATLERVNRTSNTARAAALQRNVFEGSELREIVKAEVERAKLPDSLVRPTADRVEESLRRRTGKQQRFSQFQALAMPASGCQVNSRMANRNRSVATMVSLSPLISSRTPVSIGSVSSRPAATATWPTA